MIFIPEYHDVGGLHQGISRLRYVIGNLGLFMVTLIDTVSPNQVRPRHPEKVSRPDAKSRPSPTGFASARRLRAAMPIPAIS